MPIDPWAQEKIQAHVGFFGRSIQSEKNETIKKWVGMGMFSRVTKVLAPSD